jgi:transcriptional regulator with XRE-family HTH domain
MKFNLERLNQVAMKPSEAATERARERAENREWLLKSAKIALELHRYLRTNGITQKELADMLGVTPAQVTKIMSGKENLGLKTICKIERVLGIELMKIPTSRNTYSSMVEVLEKKEMPTNFITPTQQLECKVVNMNAHFQTGKRMAKVINA